MRLWVDVGRYRADGSAFAAVREVHEVIITVSSVSRFRTYGHAGLCRVRDRRENDERERDHAVGFATDSEKNHASC